MLLLEHVPDVLSPQLCKREKVVHVQRKSQLARLPRSNRRQHSAQWVFSHVDQIFKRHCRNSPVCNRVQEEPSCASTVRDMHVHVCVCVCAFVCVCVCVVCARGVGKGKLESVKWSQKCADSVHTSQRSKTVQLHHVQPRTLPRCNRISLRMVRLGLRTMSTCNILQRYQTKQSLLKSI